MSIVDGTEVCLPWFVSTHRTQKTLLVTENADILRVTTKVNFKDTMATLRSYRCCNKSITWFPYYSLGYGIETEELGFTFSISGNEAEFIAKLYICTTT